MKYIHCRMIDRLREISNNLVSRVCDTSTHTHNLASERDITQNLPSHCSQIIFDEQWIMEN